MVPLAATEAVPEEHTDHDEEEPWQVRHRQDGVDRERDERDGDEERDQPPPASRPDDLVRERRKVVEEPVEVPSGDRSRRTSEA
jgi:hypothetical protein